MMSFLQCRPIFKYAVARGSLLAKFSLRSFSCNLNRQRFLLPKLKDLTSKRTLTSWNKIFKNIRVEELKALDQVPQSCELIYYSGLKKYLLGCQIASSLIFISGAMLVIYQTVINGPDPKTWLRNPKNFEEELTLYATFSSFILVAVVLSIIVQRMPIRIYHRPQKNQYALVFYNSIPFQQRTISCNMKDISKMEERGVLPWKNSRFQIKNEQTVIFLENCFRRPADFNIMVGYQKQ